MICGAVVFGVQQIASAPERIVTFNDFTTCTGAAQLTWPWARLAWAYGFTLLGALVLSTVVVVRYSFRA